MKIGYIRVSTQEQNTLRQEILMETLVAIIAGLAEGDVFIPGIVIPVDTLSATGADHGFLIGAAFAKRIVTHHDAILQRVLLSTVAAGKGFSLHQLCVIRNEICCAALNYFS